VPQLPCQALISNSRFSFFRKPGATRDSILAIYVCRCNGILQTKSFTRLTHIGGMGRKKRICGQTNRWESRRILDSKRLTREDGLVRKFIKPQRVTRKKNCFSGIPTFSRTQTHPLKSEAEILELRKARSTEDGRCSATSKAQRRKACS